MYSKTAHPSDMAKGNPWQAAAKVYLKQVKKRLPCSRSLRSAFLSQLEDEISLYCEETGNLSYEMLIGHFGSPEEVADNLLSELEPEAMWKYTQFKRKILYFLCAIALIAMSLITFAKVHTYKMQQDVINGGAVESIVSPEESINNATYHMITPDGFHWAYDKQNGSWENDNTCAQ